MLGPYRDRVLVELASNAADAAALAGGGGRLALRLHDVDGRPTLTVANTGHPLTADGVAGLASLRASGKSASTREPAGAHEVGRFGVGFAATLTLSDEPLIVSTDGGLRFSAADTLSAVTIEGVPIPGGRVPVLRLPSAATAEVPDGYVTAVVLPLRDDEAVAATRRLLGEVGDPMLLALPALAAIEVHDELAGAEPRVVRDVHDTWITMRRTGIHDPSDLAGHQGADSVRRQWQLTWAIPRALATTSPTALGLSLGAGGPVVPEVVHAPTPSQEVLRWPALLIADLPLDPGRQHVQPGPATDRIVQAAAEAYTDLVALLARDPHVPTARLLACLPDGAPAGWLEVALRQQLVELLPDVPCLRSVEANAPVRPRDAVVLSPPVSDDLTVLAAVAGVLSAVVAAPAASVPLLQRIGVRRTDLAEIVESWPEADEGGWVASYARLAVLAGTPEGREALARIPVPLQGGEGLRGVDGRVRRGARGVVLPDPSVPSQVLDALAREGLPVPADDVLREPAAVDLLTRLGARPATPADVLSDPRVADICSRAADIDHPEILTASLLDLVVAAGDEGGALPWLGYLLVPDADGDLVEAALLTLPGSAMSRCFDAESVGEVASEWAQRWPVWAWQRLGVAAAVPVLVTVHGAPHPSVADLDGLDEWLAAVGGGPQEHVLVRDLDLVDDNAWATVVDLLRGDPLGRRAWDPVRVPGLDGLQSSYLVWWLRERLELAGSRGLGACTPALDGLTDAPEWTQQLPTPVQRELGIVTAAADLGPTDWTRLLSTPSRPTRASLLALWRAMSGVEPPVDAYPPTQVWALGADLEPTRTNNAVVLDDARWLQRADLGPRLIMRAQVALPWADTLDLDLASERAAGVVTTTGTAASVPGFVHERFVDAPRSWWRHDGLAVDGQPVRWWVDRAGACHGVDLDSLAQALAFAVNAWPSRYLIARLLQSADDLTLDAADPGVDA